MPLKYLRNASAERGGYSKFLLLSRRRRLSSLSFLPAFRLPLSLVALSSGSRTASLLLLLQLLTPLLLLLLCQLLMFGRQWLSLSAAHSFSLSARFVRLSCCAGLRRDLLMSSCRTSASSALFRCSHRSSRGRRAELYRCLMLFWRILWRLTLPWTFLLAGTPRRRAPTFLVLRPYTLQS